MQLYLFTYEFHFIEIGKKIRAHGHNFEDVISACLNWMNPMKDVTDLVGHLEAPRWYNILERNRRQTLDHWLFTCEDIRQYPTSVGAHMQLYLFTHWFHFIEIGKKIRACGHDFEDVVSAYLNWKNPRKDVTDLIGQMEVLTVLKVKKTRHLKRKIRLQASEYAQDIEKYKNMIEELKLRERHRELVFYAALHHIYQPTRMRRD